MNCTTKARSLNWVINGLLTGANVVAEYQNLTFIFYVRRIRTSIVFWIRVVSQARGNICDKNMFRRAYKALTYPHSYEGMNHICNDSYIVWGHWWFIFHQFSSHIFLTHCTVGMAFVDHPTTLFRVETDVIIPVNEEYPKPKGKTSIKLDITRIITTITKLILTLCWQWSCFPRQPPMSPLTGRKWISVQN